MKIKVNYEIIKKQYPIEIIEIENKIRKGKSKHKNDNLESFNWYFDWCTLLDIENHSLDEILTGIALLKQQKWNAMSIDDRVENIISRSNIGLMAEKGKGRWYSSSFKIAPPEIREHYRKILQRKR